MSNLDLSKPVSDNAIIKAIYEKMTNGNGPIDLTKPVSSNKLLRGVYDYLLNPIIKVKKYKCMLMHFSGGNFSYRVLNSLDSDSIGDINWVQDGYMMKALGFFNQYDVNLVAYSRVLEVLNNTTSPLIMEKIGKDLCIYFSGALRAAYNVYFEIQVYLRGDQPKILLAETNEEGTLYYINFDKELISVPLPEYFSDSINGGWFLDSSIDKDNRKRLVLIIDGSISWGDEIYLSLEASTGVIESNDLGALNHFENIPVINRRPDPRPLFVSLQTDESGSRIDITFDKTVDIIMQDAITIKKNGLPIAFDDCERSDLNIWSYYFNDPFVNGDVITITAEAVFMDEGQTYYSPTIVDEPVINNVPSSEA